MSESPTNGAGRVQLPPARDLQAIVRDAEDAVSRGDASRALGLLREMVAWVGLKPNPAERQRVAGMIRDPALISGLVSLPVTIQRDMQRPGSLVSSPQGDLVVCPMLLAMPLANMNFSRVLITAGQDPLGDMLPLLDARMVLPRARMQARVLDVVEGRAPATPETPT